MSTDAVLGITIPFAGTALGAACVLFMKKQMGTGLQRVLTGFASGVMVAALIWSLIVPAMEQTQGMAVGVVYAGFLAGNSAISAGGALALALGIAIQNFPEGSKAPYAIMHYDLVVKDVANRWLNESLSDPLSNGTQYADLIRQLIKSIGNTANVIAKNAAKWGMD